MCLENCLFRSGTHPLPLMLNYLSLWILPIQVLSHNKFLTPSPPRWEMTAFCARAFSVLIFAFAPGFLGLPLLLLFTTKKKSVVFFFYVFL